MTAADLTLDQILKLLRVRYADQITDLAATCDCTPCTAWRAVQVPQSKPCAGCGQTMTKRSRSSTAQWGRRKYCAPECVGLGRRRAPATKTCELPACGETFAQTTHNSRAKWERQRFCSRRCSGLSRRPAEAETKTCALDGCDVVFTRIPGRGLVAWEARRFCSRVCTAAGARSTAQPKPKTRPVKSAPSPAPVVAPAAPQRPVWRPAGFTATPNARRAS